MDNKGLPKGFNNPVELEKRLRKEPEEAWERRGLKSALGLFTSMVKSVPAYKDFLKANKFNPNSVTNSDDLVRIPKTNKDNYLRKYPREMLTWDKSFSKNRWVISSTSGSTGKPYYFPRQDLQDKQYAVLAELYLRSNFQIHKKTTLYIVTFPMGAWIGGLFTYEAIKQVADRGGYDISIITPGVNKQEVINAVKELHKDFDQIIIGAYAPFLRDIIDDGIRQGIKWHKINLSFIFSAEAFSEKFRDYIIKETGLENEITTSLNHYGTVDMGTMAHETPLTILARRLAFKNNKLAETIFPETRRQPTLAQYIPELFYFQSEDNNLICSSNSGIPLLRYDLKDFGGILKLGQVEEAFQAQGINLRSELKKHDAGDTLWNLPLVYVYERDDFSVSYYAFLVYPDSIRRVLQTSKFNKLITGKFTMFVDYTKSGKQKFYIHVELTYGHKPGRKLSTLLKESIHKQLLLESSEYRETYGTIGVTVKPTIKLWPYESEKYFRPGTKQRWVIK